ncbi:hypothetical protein [uncultured Agrobacterium sp.]|uniref:hypothetical protein n=1 Tax=uncultured Agrobacterium sp. TaxID=157277 RepID=UPI0025E82DF3|nr:hypothetical protein [uncultured Agrobacterium sp.]
MSLAIGLGGFMDGFAKGQQIRQGWENEERKKVADERAKVLADRQDVEYNRVIAQRNEIDKINADAKTTFDAQVNAGTQQPGDFDQFWNKFALPKMKNTYLANGDLDNARRVQEWGETEDAKNGARLFAGALVKAQTGDGAGALADVIKAGQVKGYINNGYEVLGQEPIVTPEGANRGFRIQLRTPDGKEVTQDIQTSDLPKLIATFGNPEAAWNSQIAARAVADKEAANLRTYEEKKKIDRQYGVGDTKQRTNAITSLRKRFDGGLGGTDKKFDDMPVEEKEKLIEQELALQRGDGQVGLAGVGAAPTERKVLVDTITGKPVPQQKAKAPTERKSKDDDAQASSPKKAPIPGVPARAQESYGKRVDEMMSRASQAPAQEAPDVGAIVAEAEATVQNGAPVLDVARALQEKGIPEWQWPKAVQEQLRSRQTAIGLNP